MSVLLKGQNGNEVELGFIRDSYAEVQDGTGDSGWTTLSLRAATQDEAWEETSPCLNMFEFSTLAEWLEAVATGEPEFSEVELLGPELKFSLSQQGNEDVTIRVGFHLDDRPEEMNVDADTDEAEYVDLHMSRESVKGAAASLRATLEKLGLGSLKDDLTGTQDAGLMGEADDDLNIVDNIVDEPPGAGYGEDNAGNS
jgi:hypothetical protein